MISEHSAKVEWRNLFCRDGKVTSETFREAKRLIAKLPPESPLRLRLSSELKEIRKLATSSDASKKS